MPNRQPQGKEFVRVGYYVNNEYADADLAENPPEKPLLDKLQRNIMSDHPRRAARGRRGRAGVCWAAASAAGILASGRCQELLS